MRITNKIMQNNSLNNINNNKVLQDNLNTQISTQKKITRPSDDPVIAIRALRLRTNVSEVTQYYEKNVPDAKSWLSVTEEAINTTTAVITDMQKQFTKGSNGDLTTTDRKTILEQLKALRDEVYATGDADYAGRSVFTGYRTDSKLSFQSAETELYRITEQLTTDSLESISYVDQGDVGTLNSSNLSTTAISEQDVEASDVYRIRLAYNDLDQGAGVTAPSISYYDTTGTLITVTPTIVSEFDTVTNAYTDVAPGGANYIPETGEVILDEALYLAISAAKDDPATAVNEGEIRIAYDKSRWAEGDLKPEHYFACTKDPLGTPVIYNPDYLTGTAEKQVIKYDVGYNQSLQVNTTADECFTHDVGRDVEEMVRVIEEVDQLESLSDELTKLMEGLSETDASYATVKGNLATVNKALTLATDKMQKMFENGITKMQDHLDQTNLALTNMGTRSARLEMTESRLQAQQTNYKTLQSQNEDADVTEVAIQLSSAELSYQAALLATGKIAQTTLLDYI